ncbi:MAG: DUF4910 domain-containing protein [Rubripirellula sp.]|nr:DUF4910 domain-containing protein [Rubripirellula sp.]
MSDDGPGLGRQMHELAARLYPIHRAITGEGVRQTFAELSKLVPLQVREVPTGTDVLDWQVPEEWSVQDAYIADAATGERIIDISDSNLHVVNCSVPVDAQMSWEELEPYLWTVPGFPERIPYRTGYFRDVWGFCLSEHQKDRLAAREAGYRVVIDSKFFAGSLSYGEVIIPGASDRTVMIYTHCCHPSLANDNLSGIVVATYLAMALQKQRLRHSYHIVMAPATIGAISWLSCNEELCSRIDYGLVLALVGDAGPFTYKRSRRETSAIDRIAGALVSSAGGSVRSFSPLGYDERQFCSPGFNLPMGCLMRTPPGEFDQYHTSADNLDYIHADSLEESLNLLRKIVERVESNVVPISLRQKGEPRLGEYGLYRAYGEAEHDAEFHLAVMWVLNQADGGSDLHSIADRAGLSFELICKATDLLRKHGLVGCTTD